MEILPILNISIWVFAKAMVVLFLVIYLIFALVVWRQVNLMTKTLVVGFEFPIKLIAVLHLIFAVIVLAVSLFVL